MYSDYDWINLVYVAWPAGGMAHVIVNLRRAFSIMKGRGGDT
jgi:hypothetical protein